MCPARSFAADVRVSTVSADCGASEVGEAGVRGWLARSRGRALWRDPRAGPVRGGAGRRGAAWGGVGRSR